MSSVRRPEYAASDAVELGCVIKDPQQPNRPKTFEVKAKFAVVAEPRRSLSERQTTWLSGMFDFLGHTDNAAFIQHRLQ